MALLRRGSGALAWVMSLSPSPTVDLLQGWRSRRATHEAKLQTACTLRTNCRRWRSASWHARCRTRTSSRRSASARTTPTSGACCLWRSRTASSCRRSGTGCTTPGALARHLVYRMQSDSVANDVKCHQHAPGNGCSGSTCPQLHSQEPESLSAFLGRSPLDTAVLRWAGRYCTTAWCTRT